MNILTILSACLSALRVRQCGVLGLTNCWTMIKRRNSRFDSSHRTSAPTAEIDCLNQKKDFFSLSVSKAFRVLSLYGGQRCGDSRQRDLCRVGLRSGGIRRDIRHCQELHRIPSSQEKRVSAVSPIVTKYILE